MLMPTDPNRLPHGGRDPEWEREPNFAKWIDAATGYRCMLTRATFGGHLCGYVRVPRGYPCYGRPATWRGPIGRLRAHGGITYAQHKTRPRGFWVGFDCGHNGDYQPSMADLLRRSSKGLLNTGELDVLTGGWPGLPPKVYRNIDYVRQQCTELAAQLKRMERRK
jgi:hypothetical protein